MAPGPGVPNVLRIFTVLTTCLLHTLPYEAHILLWEQIRVVDTAAELMVLVTYILPPRTILTIPYGGCF